MADDPKDPKDAAEKFSVLGLPLRSDFSLFGIMQACPTEESAVQYFEGMRWGGAPTCPACKSVDVYRIGVERRLPLYNCRACRHQFTVTSGTVMDNTKLPLQKWALAFHLMGGSKKGMSAQQLSRALDVTPKTAWHLGHRIRATMTDNAQCMSGTVESGETYIGGRRKHMGRGYRGNKVAVQTIVERTQPDGTPGQAQTIALQPPADAVDGRTVGAKLRTHVCEPQNAVLMTDESPIYGQIGKAFMKHHTVNHKQEEYVREEKDGTKVHTNTVEGFFGNLKRQLHGTHHHTSKKHLPRYLEEFDYKYNTRDRTDGERTAAAIKRVDGKRVTLYKSPVGGDSLSAREHPVQRRAACERQAAGLTGQARANAIKACLAAPRAESKAHAARRTRLERHATPTKPPKRSFRK